MSDLQFVAVSAGESPKPSITAPGKTSMDKRLYHALVLARLGFRIFPLLPGSKEPYRSEGWKAIMTTNEERIRYWFANRPDMNYAVVCDDTHVIIDPDEGFTKNGRKKEGIQNFLRAEKEALGFIEESIFKGTLRVRTPKGGVHLYFCSDKGYANSVGTIIPDVDVRGPDGYVVGPGCWTYEDLPSQAEGSYTVEIDGTPANLPDWLRLKLDQGGLVGKRAENAGTLAGPVDLPASIETACRFLRERAPALEGEGGDLHTVKTAMGVKDYGVSEDKCFALMFGETLFPPDAEHPDGCSWNDTCEPPWDFDDLRLKVHNAYKFGNNQIGAKMDALSTFGTEKATPEIGVDGRPTAHSQLSPGEHFSAVDQPIGEDPEARKIGGLIMPISAFIARKADAPQLIPGWVPSSGMTALLGKRGLGKTVCLSDMANCIVTETPWNGITVAKGRSVIYFCGEDDIGLQYHMHAWQLEHGKVPADDRLFLASVVPNLMDAQNLRDWTAELKNRLCGRPVVIFLDTWQRATSSASQNDDTDMQMAVHNAEALARDLGGCAIVAFHPPKGNEKTILGSVVIENSTTSILQMEKDQDTIRLRVERIKGRGEGNALALRFKEIDLGTKDTEGHKIAGVVPVYLGGSGVGLVQRELDEQQRKIVLRSHYAKVVRELVEKERKPLSPNQVVALALRRHLRLGEMPFPTRTRANQELPELFRQPHLFDDQTKLELVERNPRKREFRLLPAGRIQQEL